MPRIALATCAEYAKLPEDDRMVLEPLRRRGIEAVPAVWTDPGLSWSSFDLVAIRSTWDYAHDRDRFLSWAASVPRLANPLPVVRWNTDKRYLRDLENAGIPVVPTRWLEPGSVVELPGTGRDRWQEFPDGTEYVLKPAVGAGSVDAGRYRAGEPGHAALARAHVERLLAREATVMMQPYLPAVDAFGETAMLFFGGVFSHAIRKGPMLTGPDRGVDGLYRAERISPRLPSELERKTAHAVLEALPVSGELLYARVDLVPGADGAPMVLEVELTEPSLFFAHDPQAAERFADAVAGMLAG